ncbi:MAG: alpha/beta hydrolase [Candidatus Omnitrophota bacterium]|jgi:acetyl esterase/lipase
MKHIVLIIIALMLVAGVAFAESKKDEIDFDKSGAMSIEELCRESITFELDIPYADTGNPRHRLDLYLPENPKSDKLPVIVFFHGGGWFEGDKSDGAGRLMPFLRTGQYAGISVSYRLSGEVQWPEQLYDCKAAIRWVGANAAKYGLDADRIGVWGVSAGGHLVLMLGVSGDAPELEGDIGPHQDVSSKVAAVVNFFGVSELLAIIDEPSEIDRTRSDAPEAMLIGGCLEDNPEKAKAASPITYVTSSDPPVLTVHGTQDPIVPYDQAVRLDAALRKAGVPDYFVTIRGGGHGDFGTAADDRVKAFFDKYLCGKNVKISTRPVNKPKS